MALVPVIVFSVVTMALGETIECRAESGLVYEFHSETHTSDLYPRGHESERWTLRESELYYRRRDFSANAWGDEVARGALVWSWNYAKTQTIRSTPIGRSLARTEYVTEVTVWTRSGGPIAVGLPERLTAPVSCVRTEEPVLP